MTAARVIQKIWLSSKTYKLRTERTQSRIRAGQCFSVGTSDLGINREYSMYSGASDNHLDFLIRKIDDGIVSSRLAQCQEGDLVQLSGPFGDFCLREEDIAQKHFIFIASGTGIAPFHSFALTYTELKFTLYHGVRHEDELYDSGDYKKGSYLSAISAPRDGSPGTRVTDLLRNASLPTNSLYYLCGNQKMIVDAIKVLRDSGVHGGSIFTETFF